MFKKTISLLAVLCMLCCLCCAASAAPAEEGHQTGDLLWESDLSSGDLETAGLTLMYIPENAQAGWEIMDLNGKKTLRGQIAMFNDAIVRLTDGVYKDVTIEANINLERGNAVSIIGRLQDDGRGYAIILDQFDGVKLCQKVPYMAWKTGGIVEAGTDYHVVLSMSGNQIKAKVTNLSTNESIIHEIENDEFADPGYIGFAIFGFDVDGVSTATGLISDIKVYAGAVDLNTLGPNAQEPEPSEKPTDPPAETKPQEPEFSLTAKYTDVTVDQAAKKVTLTRALTVSELKGSFDAPRGYSAKVLDKDGAEVTDEKAAVRSGMRLVYAKEGTADQVYTIETPASAGNTWIIVAAAVAAVLAVAVVVLVVLRKKKK